MELPRNITQVGETDRNCKIYVEDYVVSYMRQMNKFAEEKEITVALYGKMTVEQQVTYCFVYGACMVQSISREVRHLSQAQNQEIERFRKKYFPEQSFLGYQILNGEMIEGFRIYDQNSCRYVKGYACFFEKNDTMLAYMLEARLEEAQPEKVEQDKYDVVKRRQEERRLQFEEKQPAKRTVQETINREEERNTKFKVAPFIAVAACCLVFLTFWGNDNMQESVKGKLTAWIADLTEPKLSQDETGDGDKEPVIIEGQEESQEVQAVMSTLVTEDKLADAILEENESAAESMESASTESAEAGEIGAGEVIAESSQETVSETLPEAATETSAEPTTESSAETSAEPATESSGENSAESEQTVQRIESYVIQPGDTLIAISNSVYGNDAAVAQICALNNISDPDNIQIGQKILLP